MADYFARVLDAVMPITFDTYWAKTIGLPRIYSLDRDGLLLGSATTTYGFGFDGAYGGSRARNATEAAWGTPRLSSPRAVGRLWDSKTLWQIDSRNVIGSVASLAVGPFGSLVNVTLPLGVGRQLLTCTISPDGRSVIYLTAAAGSNNGSATGDQWHIVQWTGSAFIAVRSGTVAAPMDEYVFGPGTTAQLNFSAGMIESDLTTIWVVSASSTTLYMFRIGADNVLRLVRTFSGASERPLTSGSAYPAIYADKGLCAVVGESRLTIFTRIELASTAVAAAVDTPFDGYSLRLVQIDNGRFDLAFYDPAQGDGPAVETLVYAALFTDAEAPARREPDRYQRRGWWADAEAGSGLWHVRRQPLGSAARREAIEMVRAALEAHGITGVDVQEVVGIAAGVSSLVLKITGFYAGRQFVMDVPL